MQLPQVMLLVAVVSFSWVAPAVGADSPFQRVSASELPAVSGMEGDLETFKLAVHRQVDACAKMTGDRKIVFGKRKVSRKNWCLKTGREFLKLAQGAPSLAVVYEKAKTRFEWYRSVGGDGKGQVLFTGYYFPNLMGTTRETAQYRVPLYAKPADLAQIEEGGKKVWRRKNADGSYSIYPDRRAIEEGGLLKGSEVAFVADPYEAFIFEVQGAGAITLDEGGRARRMVLNYAAQNGRTYVSIRRILQEKGVDAAYLSIPGMRRYFQEHPEELKPTLWQNPSVVFFKQDTDGPYGVDTLLSAGHSIAIDQSVYPLGAFTLLKTNRPLSKDGEVSGWQDFSRLAVTQDVGGAIKGAGRVDVYWGEDAYAEFASGLMNQPGELYFAVLP